MSAQAGGIAALRCQWQKKQVRLCAASGRKSKAAISAAVEKREDRRKPDAFFGHRKVECA